VKLGGAAGAAAMAMGPDALSLPGSAVGGAGVGVGLVADLGRLAEVDVPVSDEMVAAVSPGTAGAGALPASAGIVATGSVGVFAAPDAWLPPASLALATLHRFDQVLVMGGEFRCEASAACLYWHHVLYGKGWREGWVAAGNVVPVAWGTASADGTRVAYLTPRARLPFTPTPFFSAKAHDEAFSDVYDLWLYDADESAFGRVDTFHVKAGTSISDLGWEHSAIVVRSTDKTVFRTVGRLGSEKKPAKKRAKKKAAPPKPPTPRA
jgi:hypothetical protein